MLAYNCPYPAIGTAQRSMNDYPAVQQQGMYGVPAQPIPNPVDCPEEKEEKGKRKYYTPFELRTPTLVAFCILTLTIFLLLQITAAAFPIASSVHALIGRSTEPEPASVSALEATRTLASRTTPTSSLLSTFTLTPTAPLHSFWTDPEVEDSSIPHAPKGGSWTAVGGWRPSYYFVGAYLPTMAAIIFSIWWKCIFARMKEMEPFYLMSRPEGAKAQDSILFPYPGGSLKKTIWSSFTPHHRLSFLGCMNMVLITVCTLFASETVFISSTGAACGVIVNPTTESNGGCHMHLTMRLSLSWALDAVLVAVFTMTVIIILRLRRSVSGILAEATSIAGVASLYNRSMAQKSSESLHYRSRKYTLPASDANGTNSIVEMTPAPFLPSKPESTRTAAPKGHKKHHIAVHPAALITFWLFLIGIFVLILYYRFVSEPGTGDVIEDFLDSQSFGVRLFMTVLGLVVQFYWGWIEEYMRGISPYTALASEHGATAAQSVLVRSSSHPVTALFHRNTWRSPLLGIVTLIAILSEVLVITLNAIPFSTATAYPAFIASVNISVAILAVMLVTVPAVLVWKMGYLYRVEIPETPECIADVFELLGDPAGWSSLGLLTRRERDRAVRSWNIRFKLRKEGEGEVGRPVWRIIALPNRERVV
ncbi:hypothetical protein K458DRAFT_490230 [Lentithecium fluviatile CBS 122367]|uniref:Uncharacterized protein n=1 Tax=Lentithecium fluviatile CBS 122367 TaxID=1168545 RepID=A0A6G1IP98_9PLEO|nr:hypothetical protein K458DRAFT_490230 [Lentithecium fluviatile CBS 122367]